MLQAKQIEEEYNRLIKARDKPIKNNAIVLVNLQWQKSRNDLLLSEGLLKISTNEKLRNIIGYDINTTFFDWVIVTSYYAIFHATHALLGLKNIKIQSRLHHATLIAFAKHFIINNYLAEELFLIYEDAEQKARDLLEIFEEEKEKRGQFQYHRLSKYNLEPAMESIENAKTFLDAVGKVMARKNII